MAIEKVVVRSFRKDEWKTYREIRLSALMDSPDAFGTTYEESLKLSDAAWRARLHNASDQTDYAMAATTGSRVIGLGWVRIELTDPGTAHLYQMWVAPEARRKGAGRKLLESAISWSTARHCTKLLLDVTCGDRPARRLYDAFGFRPVGDPLPLREGSELLEQPMALVLPTQEQVEQG